MRRSAAPDDPARVSRQARDLLKGTITVHRTLPLYRPTVDKPPAAARREASAAGYPQEQWRAALDRRRSDIADLAGVAEELAAIDTRAAELNRRITELLALAIS